MTLKIRVQVPKGSGPYEAVVTQKGTDAGFGKPVQTYLAPGDELEVHVHSGMSPEVFEVPAGTKASRPGAV